MPVLDTGIQFLVVSLKMLYSALVYDRFCWIPVSRHWDDTLLVSSNHNARTAMPR
ncbi:WPE palindromic element domain-containing protein [Wolbachia endosymbiont (group A) of Anomoia purmunda]|uniref:WPE palindromic element domain-containing protein n=1 Tax=Wolbachia endosymbiont (group A) of Anomoia purmunda TaxID=2953978 RepID=UPI0039799903